MAPPMPPLALLLLALGATPLLVSEANAQSAPSPCDATFGNSPLNDWITCSAECTAWSGSAYSKQKNVVGTFTYTGSSPVCLSALHAGFLLPGEEKHLMISRSRVNTSFVATVRNRVTSKKQAVRPGEEILGYTITSAGPASTPASDLSHAELIMVHNNNHPLISGYNEQLLFLACLPNNQGESFRDTRFHRWSYDIFPLNHRDITSLQQDISGVQATDHPQHNSRVLRCLGPSPALDVTGVFGRANDGTTPNRPTVTASIGETVTLAYTNNARDLERLPANEGAIRGTQINGVQLQDAGLYRRPVGYGNDTIFVYSRLIVRACPPHRYGPNCGGWCPDCMNGGECDAVTGRCVCAPGTSGSHCQDYCANDQYGAQCHLSCAESTLLWSEVDSSCSGLTACVRDPKGCSCLPGYMPPNCDYPCAKSYYGPDCDQQCDYCNYGNCDRVSGQCTYGCKDPRLCTRTSLPLNLPRLRTPPGVTGCSNTRCFVSLVAWNRWDHDGELAVDNVVTGYELQVQSHDGGSDWMSVAVVQATQVANDVRFNFVPGRRYSSRVRVLTSVGTADPSYNLRLRETVVRMPCLESYTGLEIFVKEKTPNTLVIAGMNDESCSASLQYSLMLKDSVTGRVVKNITSSKSEEKITRLTPNTTYAVIIEGNTKTVTTPPLPPLTPEKVELGSITSHSAWASWSKTEGAEHYIVTLQSLGSEGCTAPEDRSKKTFNLTENRLYLGDLIPYERYDLCVYAVNEGGQSVDRCQEFTTSAAYVPNITLSNLDCLSGVGQLTCYVTSPDDCGNFNGNAPTLSWTLRGGPACNASLMKTDGFNETYRSGRPWHSFYGLTSRVTYTVEVFVQNEVGQARPGLAKVFQPSPVTAPGPVQQLDVNSNATAVFLNWAPPCPALAPVSHYEVFVGTSNGWTFKNVALPYCPGQQDHFCYSQANLRPKTRYNVKVRSCASRKCSTEVSTNVVTRNSAPGPPSIQVTGRETSSISANFTAPPYLGAEASCFFAVTTKENTVYNNTKDEDLTVNSVWPYTVPGLPLSSLLFLTGRCCNVVNCSATVEVQTSTLLTPPQAISGLKAGVITDTNATLLLPAIQAGNANVSLVVLVQNITGKPETEPANFTAHYANWKQQNSQSPGKKRRSATNQRCSDPSPSVYVAGTVEQGEEKFVLGSGDDINCELIAGNSYRVAVLAEATLLDDTRLAVFKLSHVLTAGVSGGLTYIIIVVIVLILVVIIGIVVFVYRGKKQQQKQPAPESRATKSGENQGMFKALSNNIPWLRPNSSATDKKPLTNTDRPAVTLTAPTPPPTVPGGGTASPLLKRKPAKKTFPAHPERSLTPTDQPSNPGPGIVVSTASGSALFSKPMAEVQPLKVPRDPIYQDLAEEPIYGNDSAVPAREIEAYLNQTINSTGIVNDFMLVPKNYPKSMSDGELPQNKHKNRYRNNLPYNDTRVRLTIMNNDPCSDYINASHVQGVTSDKHYIAAQGPKDSADCTIPDFWRMVVENNVDVIIMVANFVEKNVVKVGLYFNSNGPIALEPLTGSVHVISQDVTPFCTVSVIQVTLVLHGSTETRQVTHYHYTKWPDHGVPKEIHTLAQMLHYIATNHRTMCALVHCSAGIGRTGTVIFDLLCYDHLETNQKLDLIAVLTHLRQSRARLVENQMQFKLSLQLLDEILFGFANVTSASELQSRLPELLAECPNIFGQLSCLPSSLEYKTGARSENIAFNRSRNILPADTRMIFFQTHSGQSPYINAVSLDSHSESDTYIIAEHPMKATLESFWEMIIQKSCPILVVLNNSFDEQDYPQLFPENVDEQMQFSNVTVKTTNVDRVASDLITRNVTASVGKSQHCVVLYEVLHWPLGASVPRDHTTLVRVADIILGGSLRSSHPPLLVCGDGVTACGLMAGVLRVVERVMQCQEVDIYRTGVMLRRCRQELIVDHTQLQVMLRAAVDYLSSFQDYDNFK